MQTRVMTEVVGFGVGKRPDALIRLLFSCVMLPGMSAVSAGDGANSKLTVSTDFEGGAAVVTAVDSANGAIHIRPPVHVDQGWPCWWYARIDGVQKGMPLTLEVHANPNPYRGKQVLWEGWVFPDQAAISVDNISWQHTARGRREGRSAIYTFHAPAETVWVAWGPPFLPSHVDQLIKEIARKLPEAEEFVLAHTRQGHPVKGIRIVGGTRSAPAKHNVWVQARQHAWEAGSSWVGKGFIEWIASDDEAAIALRRIASIHFIPIMDVDNVAMGAGGKDAVPRDHNRDWTDKPIYPEVAAAQQKILELDKSDQFDVFIDLHNPGPGDRKPFFFGPHNLNELTADQQQNYARWLALASDTISGPLPLFDKYRIASYIRTDEERNRMSANWVRNHTSERALSVTLETSWNTSKSTQQGYQTVGQQLAEALARYLSRE